MGEFSMTMSKKFSIQLLPSMVCCKVLEGVGQLTKDFGIKGGKREWQETYLFKIGNMLAQVA
jgi:hypothetical protein